MTAAWKEPLPGWIDNLNGPTGVLAGAGKGILRTLLCRRELIADLIPVDIAINLLIAVAWQTAQTRWADDTSDAFSRTWRILCELFILSRSLFLYKPRHNFQAEKCSRIQLHQWSPESYSLDGCRINGVRLSNDSAVQRCPLVSRRQFQKI